MGPKQKQKQLAPDGAGTTPPPPAQQGLDTVQAACEDLNKHVVSAVLCV